MEVAPTIHYVMGGVRVEAGTGVTTVPGLFAAGEGAAGLHGANRLGGNSLSDLIVLRKRAREHAAPYVKSVPARPRVDDAQADGERRLLRRPFESDGHENPYTIHEELQAAMAEHAGIARTGESLRQGLDAVVALQARAEHLHAGGSMLFNPGWHEC